MNYNTESDNNSINKIFDSSQNTENEFFKDRYDNLTLQNNFSNESNKDNNYSFGDDEYLLNEKPSLNDSETDMKINSNVYKNTAPLTPIEKTQKSCYNLNGDASVGVSNFIGQDASISSKFNHDEQIDINLFVKDIEEIKSKKKKKVQKLLIKVKKSQKKKMKNPQKEKIIYSK